MAATQPHPPAWGGRAAAPEPVGRFSHSKRLALSSWPLPPARSGACLGEAAAPRWAPPVVTKRFRLFSAAAQHAILQQLRGSVLPAGVFGPVPADEWLRLLQLTDPLIHGPAAQSAGPYQLLAGKELLLLLLGQYLDVP